MTTVNRNFEYSGGPSNIEYGIAVFDIRLVEGAHNFEVTGRSDHLISNMTVTK